MHAGRKFVGGLKLFEIVVKRTELAWNGEWNDQWNAQAVEELARGVAVVDGTREHTNNIQDRIGTV